MTEDALPPTPKMYTQWVKGEFPPTEHPMRFPAKISRPHFGLFVLFLIASFLPVQAQTFTVLHTFETQGGLQPFAGPTLDAAGNLYGTTHNGGDLSCDLGGVIGCGVAYKLKQGSSGWFYSVLYIFPGNSGDFLPTGPGAITFSPHGVPYGTQLQGGANYAGTVFHLQPPVTAPINTSPPWSYTLDHTFGNGDDGGYPSRIIFDSAGNIFGTASNGGPGGWGIVYEMTPAAGGWTENLLYSFTGNPDGTGPADVTLDPAGNIYGVTSAGGNQECHDNVGCGTVYELIHSGGQWTKTILHIFEQSVEGGAPGPLIRDAVGNLFGLTGEGAPGNGGTIWEMSPSNGSWTFSVLYTFPSRQVNFAGPFQPVMDASGALCGVNNWGGAHNLGSVYKLAPSNGGWIYSDLHDFGSLAGNRDGCYPRGPVALDSSGNIYGATQQCGVAGGTLFEVSP